MFNYGNSYQPYQASIINPYQQQMIKQEIIKVNGENGARAFNLAPNSSALLLDETAPVVWLIQTDGAGYKTVNAYKIEPVTKQVDNISNIEQRLSKLEEIVNAKSDTSNNAKKSVKNVNE